MQIPNPCELPQLFRGGCGFRPHFSQTQNLHYFCLCLVSVGILHLGGCAFFSTSCSPEEFEQEFRARAERPPFRKPQRQKSSRPLPVWLGKENRPGQPEPLCPSKEWHARGTAEGEASTQQQWHLGNTPRGVQEQRLLQGQPRETHLLEFQHEKGDSAAGQAPLQASLPAGDLPKVTAQKAASVTQEEKIYAGER